MSGTSGTPGWAPRNPGGTPLNPSGAPLDPSGTLRNLAACPCPCPCPSIFRLPPKSRFLPRSRLPRSPAYRAPPANGISVAGAGPTGPAGCVQRPASASRGSTPSPNQYASSRCG